MLGYASVSLLGTVAAAVEPCVSNAGNKFEYHENTELISTTVFGNGVSVAEKYLRPGDPVGLTCRLTGSASKASDGKVRHFTNVIVEQIHLIPCGRNGN
jgi:single-stranded DNA-binding protein